MLAASVLRQTVTQEQFRVNNEIFIVPASCFAYSAVENVCASLRQEGWTVVPVLMVDVAKHAGVSVTTVSHVINQTREIAPQTRERVLASITELRYYKNTSARLLVRGKSDIVGLIVSDIENPFLPPLVKSFDRACATAGLELLLGMTNYDPKKAEAAVHRMIESRVRGVAVMTSQIDGRLIDTLVQADVPVVALDLQKIGKGRSSLSIDYAAGSTEAVDHLYLQGHRRVALIRGPSRILSACRYAEVLTTTVEDYGMKLVRVLEADTSSEDGARAAMELLQSKHSPTAVLCGTDLIAIGVLGAAAHLGMRVPDDLSIIGSDDIAMASYSHPALSTVRIPRDAMGHEAFRLLENIAGPPFRRGVGARIATSFIARASSGPVRGASRTARQTGPSLNVVQPAGRTRDRSKAG